MIRLAKQLSIYLPNKPGMLANACSILEENSINMVALSVHDAVDAAVVRIVVDKDTKALLLIENEGYYVLEQDVIVIEIDHKPGGFAELSRLLAMADINIHYAYCTACEGQTSACMIIKSDNAERTLELLRGQWNE